MNCKKNAAGRLAACLLVVSVLLAALVLVILVPRKTVAADVAVTSYMSVQIQEGDTLWSLAEEYAPEQIKIADYIRSVRNINHIWNDGT